MSSYEENSRNISSLFTLDPEIVFLNHGSFGACPIPVQERQQELRDRMERQPVQFFVRDLEGMLDETREALADFIGITPAGLALLPNATAGINAVLRSLALEPGDQLLTTNHEYNACRNALHFVANHSGAEVVVAEIPFPLPTAQAAVDAILSKVTGRTRLALFDHVTSQTALVLPVRELVQALAEKGIECLVDGAHAPGMVPLNLAELGAAYYAGNCHKWLCAPKGAAFLYVRQDLRSEIHPLAISHGANSPRTSRSRYHLEFDWTGTYDPTAVLAIPAAIETMGRLLPGGWAELMERNRALAIRACEPLCQALGCPRPCPDEMIGAMASFPLPDGDPNPPESSLYGDPLQDVLLEEYRLEVPVVPWPAPPKRLLRISAQIYNRFEDFELLAGAMERCLK